MDNNGSHGQLRKPALGLHKNGSKDSTEEGLGPHFSLMNYFLEINSKDLLPSVVSLLVTPSGYRVSHPHGSDKANGSHNKPSLESRKVTGREEGGG